MKCSVRVPCSTSNLGAGFDCIGLAFSRYLTAEFIPGEQPLQVERSGTAADLPNAHDLVRAALPHDAKGRLLVHSSIPVGRGLGSSAAATVAGLLLARAIAGEGDVDPTELLQLAAAREGHPDNVAPALLGGLVAIARDETDRFKAFRLPLSDRTGFAFAAPDVEVSTPLARKVLPDRIDFLAGVRTAGRMAALVQGLATGDPELLRIGFNDELHVPYRLPLIPGAAEAFEAGRAAGAWAVTISGSGSGLIAVCARGRESNVARAMAEALHDVGSSGQACSFEAVPDLSGATIQLED